MTSCCLLVSAGRAVAHFAHTTPTVGEHPDLKAAVAAAPVDAPFLALDSVQSIEDARAFIVAVWVVDWVRHLDRLSAAPAAQQPLLA